ncbi:MAG: hypothetical protein ACIALR_14505, partial [Blastopirellula sp. JB062]
QVRWFAPAASLFLLGFFFGWLAAFVWLPLIYFYFGVLALYAIAVTASAMQVCSATRDLRSLISLVIYPLGHFSYGAGFLRGLMA